MYLNAYIVLDTRYGAFVPPDRLCVRVTQRVCSYWNRRSVPEGEKMSRRSDNPLAKVIVRNYPLTTPEKELRYMFEKIGKIDDCK